MRSAPGRPGPGRPSSPPMTYRALRGAARALLGVANGRVDVVGTERLPGRVADARERAAQQVPESAVAAEAEDGR